MDINAEIIKGLQAEFGEAFYLLDTERFRFNYMNLKDCFQKIYKKFNIAYSYKTNYIPRLCKLVDELGGYAEVVSELELELSERLHVAPDKVIWNGPIKAYPHVKRFLLAGGCVNVDSLGELAHIADIADRHKDKEINIGIRCSFDIGDGVVSRFGFDTEGRDFRDALKIISEHRNIRLLSFQCHFATRQIDYWRNRAEGMHRVIKETRIVPERIDLGGGIYGCMPDMLKEQFTSKIPSYEEYAAEAATVIAEYFEDMDNKPELVIEPGSALAGDCMKFVCTVKAIKNIRGKNFATVLGSQKNISMSGVNPPIHILPMKTDRRYYEHIDFVGYTCIEGDVLYRDYSGALAEGDVLVIDNCGSYSVVMKPPFILPNFPVLDISGDRIDIIKNGEVFDDIFRTYSF